MKLIDLTEYDIDQLKEVINIGTGHAFQSLGKMLQKVVFMSVPEPLIDSIEKMHQKMGNVEDLAVGILLRTTGDITGALLMIFNPPSALKIAALLTANSREHVEKLDNVELSAFQEIGNILLGSATTTFDQFLQLQTNFSPPDIAADMRGAIVDAVLLETGVDQQKSISIQVDLKIEEENIHGDLYYFIDNQSIDKILQKTQSKTS